MVQFGGLQAQRDQARVQSFVAILMNGCGMTAAFKDIMALINNDFGWRIVRAPLAALTDAQMVQLATQLADFALDQAID